MKKKRKKLFHWTHFIYILGIAIILYPILSNQYYKYIQRNIINEYTKQLNVQDDAELLKEKKDRINYNNNLVDNVGQSLTMPEFNTELLPKSNLKLSMADVLGVVYIPKINVRLPIYYGTQDYKLQVGTGVIEGTSLPVGGASTHSVITGHRGLPTARLFTDLPKLQLKDKFYIDTLKEKLAYEIDSIEVIEPTDIEALKIVPGEDYVTLLTCTPYMINSHRLLVRGTRVPFSVVEWNKNNKERKTKIIIKAIIIIIILLLLLLIYYYFYSRRKKKKEQLKKNKRYNRPVKHRRKNQ